MKRTEPKLLNFGRGIVLAYRKETNDFIHDPTITGTICVGSPGSGKTQTEVFPTIDIISRPPFPSLETYLNFHQLPNDLVNNRKILFDKWKSKEFSHAPELSKAILCQQSLVINDVKGEILANTYDLLRNRGYNIQVLNLEYLELSQLYNPFQAIKKEFLYAKAEAEKHKTEINWDETIDLIKDVASILQDDERSSNPFFPVSARTLMVAVLIAMVEYLLNQKNPYTSISKDRPDIWKKFLNIANLEANEMITYADCFTPTTFINLVTNYNKWERDEETGEPIRFFLQEFFDALPAFHPAKIYSSGYLGADSKLKGSIFSTMQTGNELFADTGIARLTSDHQFDVNDLIEQPTAWFVIVPDDRKTRWQLATIFHDQTYQQLSKLAKRKYGGELPRRVNFLLDEFAQMPTFRDFDMKTSMSRSRNIRWLIFLQSLAQLKIRYPEHFDDLLKDNLQQLIYIRSNDEATHDYVLKELGTRTVVRKNISHERGKWLEQQVSHSLESEPLMHLDELRELPFERSIVLMLGRKPIKSTLLSAYKYFTYNTENGETRIGMKPTDLFSLGLPIKQPTYSPRHLLLMSDFYFWELVWRDQTSQPTTEEKQTSKNVPIEDEEQEYPQDIELMD